MAMQWFVRAETTRLDLPDGQWAEVRRELSQGDEDAILERAMRQTDEGKPIANMATWWRERVRVFLVRWSLDAEINADTIATLTPAAFECLRKAIGAHEQAVDAEKRGGHADLVKTRLAVCRALGWAWTYRDVQALPADVFAALLEMLKAKDDDAGDGHE